MHHPRRAAPDLDDAVSLLRQALELAPPGQPERPVILSNLAAALQTRFDGTGERADLDDAVSLLRQALELAPPGQPRRARFKTLLSSVNASRASTEAT